MTVRSWRDAYICPFHSKSMLYLFSTDLREYFKDWECNWTFKSIQPSLFGDRNIIFSPSFFPSPNCYRSLYFFFFSFFLLLMQFLAHSEHCCCFQSAVVSWTPSVLMAPLAFQFSFLFWENFCLADSLWYTPSTFFKMLYSLIVSS